MNYPKISIIIPSYNQGNFIEEAIRSCLEQNCIHIELIIIDGASTDTTLDIIKKYEHQIAYWISEPDNGQSDAINKGLKKVTGDIVTWLGCDDLLIKDTIKHVVDVFSSDPSINLVHGNTIYQYSDNHQVESFVDEKGFPYKYLSGMAFAQPSSFFRRSSLAEIGYLNESLHYGMDYDLMLRLYDLGEVKHIDQFLSVYRVHEESKTSHSKVKFAEEWAQIFSKVVCSINPESPLIKYLEDLELYTKPLSLYRFKRDYAEDFLYQSFLYFLNFQVIFLYQAPNVIKLRPILKWLKKNEPEFFLQQQLENVYKRSFMLNDTLIRYARRVSAYL